MTGKVEWGRREREREKCKKKWE